MNEITPINEHVVQSTLLLINKPKKTFTDNVITLENMIYLSCFYMGKPDFDDLKIGQLQDMATLMSEGHICHS